MPQNLSPEETVTIILAVILIVVCIVCLFLVFCCVYLLRTVRRYIDKQCINIARRTSIIWAISDYINYCVVELWLSLVKVTCIMHGPIVSCAQVFLCCVSWCWISISCIMCVHNNYVIIHIEWILLDNSNILSRIWGHVSHLDVNRDPRIDCWMNLWPAGCYTLLQLCWV